MAPPINPEKTFDGGEKEKLNGSFKANGPGAVVLFCMSKAIDTKNIMCKFLPKDFISLQLSSPRLRHG